MSTPEEFLNHVKLEHIGISSDLLERANKSREIKKYLNRYNKKDDEGTYFECPLCYMVFSDVERLERHGSDIHHIEFRAAALEKLKNMRKFTNKNPPICEKCNRAFRGLVTTKIDGEAKNVCFNCYANHYGENALLRITIGTPNETVEQLRKPLVKKQ